MSLTLRSISVAFGSQTVLHQLDLTLATGQIACLLGQSGCGKTTALRVIAGFQAPSQGQVMLHERDLTRVPPHQRHIGMVFQDYALFPHLNVAQNIGFGLHALPSNERQNRVAELAELAGLTPLLTHYPHQISGGQQQRVALARALAPRPQLILLDEPFSNLDADLRGRLAQDVRALLKQQNTTALMVTHDQQEAFALADQIGILHQGRLIQWDSPQRLYHQPATLQVAQFIGQGSCISGRVIDRQTVQTALGNLATQAHDWAAGATVRVFIRPEQWQVSTAADAVQARVCTQTFQGHHWMLTVQLPHRETVQLYAPVAAGEHIGMVHQGRAVVFADASD